MSGNMQTNFLIPFSTFFRSLPVLQYNITFSLKVLVKRMKAVVTDFYTFRTSAPFMS